MDKKQKLKKYYNIKKIHLIIYSKAEKKTKFFKTINSNKAEKKIKFFKTINSNKKENQFFKKLINSYAKKEGYEIISERKAKLMLKNKVLNLFQIDEPFKLYNKLPFLERKNNFPFFIYPLNVQAFFYTKSKGESKFYYVKLEVNNAMNFWFKIDIKKGRFLYYVLYDLMKFELYFSIVFKDGGCVEIVLDESCCFNCMTNKKQSEMALNFEKNYTIKDLKFLLF